MGGVFQDDKYVVLTDIMGLEDHDGDMDFKVTGTFRWYHSSSNGY